MKGVGNTSPTRILLDRARVFQNETSSFAGNPHATDRHGLPVATTEPILPVHLNWPQRGPRVISASDENYKNGSP